MAAPVGVHMELFIIHKCLSFSFHGNNLQLFVLAWLLIIILSRDISALCDIKKGVVWSSVVVKTALQSSRTTTLVWSGVSQRTCEKRSVPKKYKMDFAHLTGSSLM